VAILKIVLYKFTGFKVNLVVLAKWMHTEYDVMTCHHSSMASFKVFETPPYPLYTGGICHNVLKLS
jgi:hypothetical protein